MTTELEKQFFDTFEIEQIEYTQCNLISCRYVYSDSNNCPFHNVYKIDYPQITDRHYLELILIISERDRLSICYDTVEHFKEGILECFIEDGEYFIHQVQAIFEME